MSGKSLKLKRIMYEVPQWKLAQAMGVRHSQLSAWENDRIPMPDYVETLYLKKLNELKRTKEEDEFLQSFNENRIQ